MTEDRWRLRFSLRSLLAFVTICALATFATIYAARYQQFKQAEADYEDTLRAWDVRTATPQDVCNKSVELRNRERAVPFRTYAAANESHLQRLREFQRTLAGIAYLSMDVALTKRNLAIVAACISDAVNEQAP